MYCRTYSNTEPKVAVYYDAVLLKHMNMENFTLARIYNVHRLIKFPLTKSYLFRCTLSKSVLLPP